MQKLLFNNLINRIWYSNHPAYILLIPFSLIYRLLIKVRKLLYQYGVFTINHVPVPVIIVGNFTVGGTGKTPFVIWLAEYLAEQGYKPGIIASGYGAKKLSTIQKVTSNSNPEYVGDESVLIARRTGLPVVVSPDRYKSARQLLEFTDCNMLICDDGLQHLALGRNLEIAMIDGDRKFGNNWLLPAGPLREPSNRASTVDLMISNNTGLINAHQMLIEYCELKSLTDESKSISVESFKYKQVHVISGIANPDRLHNYLVSKGVKIIPHIFPDHHSFISADLKFDDDFPIVMTEKDAVKCFKFSNDNMWYLPIQVAFDDVFYQHINTLIRDKINGQKIT